MKHLSNSAINELRHNARSVVRELGLLNDAYFAIGVTLAERHLLIELYSSSYQTVGEIAERLLLDKSTASRLIAKAVAKGYVSYATDKNDRRKRYLELTASGKSTLKAFEPIAFDQTKQALLTLTEEETETVYRGLSLYAQGLRHARIHKSASIVRMTKDDIASTSHLLAEIHKGKKGSDAPLQLKTYCKKGHALLILKIGDRLAGCGAIAPSPSNISEEGRLELLGILPEYQRLGLEKLLVGFCFEEARKLGYTRYSVDLSVEPLIPTEFISQLGFHLTHNNKKDTIHLWTLN